MRTEQVVRTALVFGASLLFRFVPFRPPNVELVLASQMPVAKVYGKTAGFFFGVLSILAFDLLTGTLGSWSLVTASAYGLLGVFASWYLASRAGTRYFVYFAIAGTLFFDAVTGLTVGPLFFGQSFTAALLGQIPFTLMHLLGNIAFALVWSTFLMSFLETKTHTTRVGLPHTAVLPVS